MGERYDVLVTMAESGPFPLVAVAEGKGQHVRAIVRGSAASGTVGTDAMPAELSGQLLALAGLSAAESVRLETRKPDRIHEIDLGGSMDDFVWTLNGKTFQKDSVPFEMIEGERVRLVLRNQTRMFHPMHLHGHTFQVDHEGSAGPRKDTVIVLPMERVVLDFDADNPGLWMLHCHNLYHQEAGMMTILGYLKASSSA